MSIAMGFGHWLPCADGDLRALGLYRRHYSSQGRYRSWMGHQRLFMGPGEKVALMTQDCRALFAWRKFIDKSGQQGVNCAIFRNESEVQSSKLILEAETFAWNRWPGARLYTYVNPSKVRSTNPGWCFQVAGWRKCGVSKGGLIILEKLP